MSNSLPLYQFMEAAQDCAEAARDSDALALSRCAELDSFIARATSDRLNSPVPSVLRLSARGMFCAAVSVALTGYHAAIFPLLRASLEAVCYAQEIAINPELRDVWVLRDRSEQDRKKCRGAFTGAVGNTCKRFSEFLPDNAGMVLKAYNLMIDSGAHPNPRSIFPSLRVRETDTHHEVAIGFVVPSQVEFSLFCCYEFGLVTSWLIGEFNLNNQDFWEEATLLNAIKNDWERELWGP